jgi:hypothetical protein
LQNGIALLMQIGDTLRQSGAEPSGGRTRGGEEAGGKGDEPEMRDRIYISLTFNALFMPPPDSFTRSREAAEEYLKTPGARTPPEIWINLACAYGQEHAFRSGDAVAQADLAAKALRAANKALEIDPSWKPRLVQLLNTDGGDDDLASLRSEPGFRALLGLK